MRTLGLIALALLSATVSRADSSLPDGKPAIAARDSDRPLARALRHAHDRRLTMDVPGVAEVVALGAGVLPACARAYGRSDRDQRRVLLLAARELDRRGRCDSAPLLAQALATNDNELRFSGAAAAGALACRALEGQLRSLLSSTHSPTQYAGIVAFEALGDPASIPWLEELLAQPDHLIRHPDDYSRRHAGCAPQSLRCSSVTCLRASSLLAPCA